MKRLLYSLLAIMAIVACSESDVDNGGNSGGGQTPPKQPEITLSTTAADFSTDGGSDVITFTSSEAWTAQVVNTRADDWCSIDPTSGPAGSAKITVTTTPNDTPDDRTASIIIKAGTASKTINVSQKQKDALTVTSSKFEVSAEGGAVSIEVKANVDFTVSKPEVSWLREVTTRGLTSHTIRYEVDPNTSYDSREAKIVVTNRKDNTTETITITQAQKDAIVLAKDSYTVDSDGDEIVIEIGHNIDFDIEIADDWITRKDTRAFVTDKLTFVIEQNATSKERVGSIKFTSEDGSISQIVTIYQDYEKSFDTTVDDWESDDNDYGGSAQ